MIFFGNFFAYVYSLHRSYGQVLIFWAIISSPNIYLNDDILNALEQKLKWISLLNFTSYGSFKSNIIINY